MLFAVSTDGVRLPHSMLQYEGCVILDLSATDFWDMPLDFLNSANQVMLTPSFRIP